MISLPESTYTLNIHDKEVYESASEVVPGKQTDDVDKLVDTARKSVLN